MRKAQIEIMGLVIIVILLIVIAVFALSFMIKPKQESEDVLKMKANALRSSILKTTLCNGVSVKDEIENCIDGFSDCGSCDDLKADLIKMVEGSLDGEGYDLKIEGFIEKKNCVDKITSVSQTLRNSNVEVALCSK